MAMSQESEKRMAADMAKIMAMICVRNTRLENLHAGIVPTSNTGDFSDVMVVDADGNKIPWNDVSHFDDNEMRELIREIVNRFYTFHLKGNDPDFRKVINKWAPIAQKWDEPELDDFYVQKQCEEMK
jgi:hypothetical protein